MRKVYLFASALILSGSAFAQLQGDKELLPISRPDGPAQVYLNGDMDRAPGDPIYTDDFSTPANWTTAADGNGNAWTIETTTPGNVDQYMGAMASTTAGNGFAVYDGISDLLASTVTAADCSVELTNSFSCTGINFVTLEFEQRYRAFNSDLCFVEVSGDNGSTWTSWEINDDEPTNGDAIQEAYRIDISSVAGGQAQVKVRFRWEELGGDPQFGSGYGWMIDDLNVFESWDYDQQIMGAYFRSNLNLWPAGLEYYLVPDEQITTITFSGETQNLGAQTQENAKLNVDVTGAGTFSSTSAPADLLNAAADSVGCTTDFTPSALGVYNMMWWFDSDSSEEVTDNDTMYDSFEVTDYEFARDNGILTSSIGNVTSNTGSPLLIGNTFVTPAAGTIGAVSIGITSTVTNEGQLMFAQIMRFNTGSGEYEYVDQTADHQITNGNLGSYVTLYFANAVAVNADDDLLVLAGHYGGTDEVRFGLAQPTDEQTVLGYTSGSTTPFFLSSPSAVMMTLDMRDFTNIVGDDELAAQIGQNVPNPFDNTSIINYTLEEANTVSVQFVDVQGRVVKTVNQGAQAAGSYQIELNGDDFAEGTYFYTFTIGDKQVTKRMVVTK